MYLTYTNKMEKNDNANSNSNHIVLHSIYMSGRTAPFDRGRHSEIPYGVMKVSRLFSSFIHKSEPPIA